VTLYLDFANQPRIARKTRNEIRFLIRVVRAFRGYVRVRELRDTRGYSGRGITSHSTR
jgi:hypothetical protein